MAEVYFHIGTRHSGLLRSIPIRAMADAVKLAQETPEGSYSFDLLTPVTLDSPTFDHRVLGRQIVTNNIAGYLACVATRTAFSADGTLCRFVPGASSLSSCEVEVMQRAADTFGSDFLEQLSRSADDVRFRRTQRLELLRCIAVQMTQRPGLARIGAALEAAIIARGDACLKRTEVVL